MFWPFTELHTFSNLVTGILLQNCSMYSSMQLPEQVEWYSNGLVGSPVL
uniref:Uncharacterized protein n=1 Tax=Rhizophora mucronata TaxID=61149 RepID=A0A2P2R1Z5_RHIMU